VVNVGPCEASSLIVPKVGGKLQPPLLGSPVPVQVFEERSVVHTGGLGADDLSQPREALLWCWSRRVDKDRSDISVILTRSALMGPT
jgi:hypothetical protein